jgi:SAM-dependent methyltransferase
MLALMDVLREVFLDRFAFTRKGWRPKEGRGQRSSGEVPLSEPRHWRSLVDEVMALHEAYTGHEGEFPGPRNPIHHRAAGYQFYYLPRNLYRVMSVLDRLPWSDQADHARAAAWMRGRERFRMLDLGCGSGAFSLAVLAWLARSGADPAGLPAGQAVLVDQSRELLEIAGANMRRFAQRVLPGWPLSIELHAQRVSRYLERSPDAGSFELVGAAMMLNELELVGSRRRSRSPHLIRQIGRQAEADGLLILVEPGTRRGYLNLMPVRDQLGEWPILYPCPHHVACPMAGEAARRWCHATVPLPRPFFFDDVLQGEGGLPLRMRELNLSALVMQATPSGEVRPPFRGRRGMRAVSAPLPGRPPHAEGAPVVLVCSPTGRLVEYPLGATGALARGDWIAEDRLHRLET